MGLGAPKKRTKLSHDPNNTNWSKSTTNFGHRILSKQGWTPGSYLGAENAAHSDHYTAANASHIRVLLREDNLGLGAKVGGNGRAETFGLATLSGIFGRLNGKSDADVQKQQGALRDAELRSWHAGKHGHMNFVRGGFLIGNEEQYTMEKPVAEVARSEQKTVKRKAENSTGTSEKSKKRRSEELEEDVDATKKAMKKNKKRKADEDTDEEDTQPDQARGDVKSDSSSDAALDDRAQRKAEKRARKEDTRKRKEEKRARKEAKAATKAISTVTSATQSETAATTPLSTGTSTPQFAGSRHAVRQRYIQQKRMASLNPQALKEILMMKAQG